VSPARRGLLFWSSAAIGWVLIGWGIRGALIHHIDTRPPELARFFVGGALVHDLLFAPIVMAGGLLVARIVPARWRAAVQAALLVSGTFALFAYPEVRGFAHRLRNPTSLPYNYGANLVIVIAVICLLSSAVTVVHHRRSRP
jgi:hypothetical protein